MTKLHWNRSRKRIFDRLMRLNRKQQDQLNQYVFGSSSSSSSNSQSLVQNLQVQSRANLFSSSSENNNNNPNSEEYLLLYNYVISAASETGYRQLVDPTHEDVTSLLFGSSSSAATTSVASPKCRPPRGGGRGGADANPSTSFISDLPLWAILLSETGLLRFVDAKRGRFPHRSYIEFLCARYAFSFPSQSMSQFQDAHTILWTPKFSTVWLLITDFAVNNKLRTTVIAPPPPNLPIRSTICHVVQEEPLSLERLSAHIAVLYTRTYEKVVDKKQTSQTDSHISHGLAELVGVPLLLRLSMIFASASSSSSPNTSAATCPNKQLLESVNPNVDLLFSAIKSKHGFCGKTIRTPRHFLWLAEHSGAVGALDAFKWIRKTYGSDVINQEVASAALSRALDKQQDRLSIANFVKFLVDPPLSIPITVAAAIKVGSLAGVTRALQGQDDDEESNKKSVQSSSTAASGGVFCGCTTTGRKLAHANPELLIDRAKWRTYLAKCLKMKWFDVAATMLRLRPKEWIDFFLDVDSIPKHCEASLRIVNLLGFIAFNLIPSEIQVWDRFTNAAIVKKKEELLYPVLFNHNQHHPSLVKSSSDEKDCALTKNPVDGTFFFNCDDTSLEVFSPSKANKMKFKQFTFNSHDVRQECDAEYMFLNNTNGWINIISALLTNECNGVIANSSSSQQQIKRISKVELCQKKVKFRDEFLSTTSTNQSNDNQQQQEEKESSQLSTNEWKEQLEYEDPLFRAQQHRYSVIDDLTDCFNRDVRCRRLTFLPSDVSSSSPYVTSWNPSSSSSLLSSSFLTHFDISHLSPTCAMHAGIDDAFVSMIFRCSPLLSHVDVSFTGGVVSDMSIKELFVMKQQLYSKQINKNTDFPFLEYLDVSCVNAAITDHALVASSSSDHYSSLIPVFGGLKSFRFAEGKGKITDKFLITIIKTQSSSRNGLVLEDIDCRSSDGKCSDKSVEAYLEASAKLGRCPLKRFLCSGAVLDSPDSSAFAVTRAFFSSNATAFQEEATGKLLAAADQLEHLDISFTSRNLGNNVVKRISSTKLKYFDIAGTGLSVTDASVESVIRKNPNLETFRCMWISNAISDISLKALAQCCPNLKVLDISWSTGISDVGIELVASKCKKLQFVNVKSNGGKVTNKSMVALAKSNNKDLRIVNALLTGGLVGQKTIDAFKQSNPLCAVKHSILDRSQDI